MTLMISPLLLKLQKESSKIIFLFFDFNMDLLKYEFSESVNSLIDILSSNFFLPHISKTSTLIDNIFSNSTSLEEIESGNVTSTFFHHLPQCVFLNSGMIEENLKVIHLFLISIKLIGSKFYAARKVM